MIIIFQELENLETHKQASQRLGTASSFPPGADTDRDHTAPQELSPEALDLSVELAQFGLDGDTAQAIIKHLVDKGLLNL